MVGIENFIGCLYTDDNDENLFSTSIIKKRYYQFLHTVKPQLSVFEGTAQTFAFKRGCL